MFWNPCHCGHASEKHYWKGMQREGACKADACGCPGFREDNPSKARGATGAATPSPGTR